MNNFNELLLKGFNLHKNHKFKEALLIYKNLLKKNKDNPKLLLFIGTAYLQINKYENAKKYLEQSLEKDKYNQSTINNLATVYEKLKFTDKAIKTYEKSINLNTSNPETFFRIANLYLNSKNYSNAINNYEKAINLKPNFLKAYVCLAESLVKSEKLKEALKCYDKVIELDGQNLEALNGKGDIFLIIKDFQKAIQNFEYVIKINPFENLVLGKLLFSKMMIHDWNDYEDILKKILQKIKGGYLVIHPSMLIAIVDDPELQLTASKIYQNQKYFDNNLSQKFIKKKREKINIGYFSSDFYEHATLRLMMEVFKFHDKSKFNICAFSYGPKVDDEYTKEFKNYLDNYYDVKNMDVEDIYSLCKKNKIDIAIDLKGLTRNNRLDIFQRRVAPIQINYLGYPGTTGLSNMDYIIADKVIIPEENAKFYSEKVLYLSNCYQPNLKTINISNNEVSKNDFELDKDKFVFCSFNNNYKVTPTVFNLWIDILKKTKNSVLWLLSSNAQAENNLKNYAKNKGVEPNRLVFANFLTHKNHLNRIKFADVFLDTFPCNAHTTASDAIRMGVPLITLKGKSFASRVAASILHECKLDELVMDNEEDYKNKAIQLCNNSNDLKKVKKKLLDEVENNTLFNSQVITQNLENIYLNFYNTKN